MLMEGGRAETYFSLDKVSWSYFSGGILWAQIAMISSSIRKLYRRVGLISLGGHPTRGFPYMALELGEREEGESSLMGGYLVFTGWIGLISSDRRRSLIWRGFPCHMRFQNEFNQ